MFHRPPKFIATPDDPFSKDKLGREDEVRRLAHLMKGTHTPLVMTVSAPWGSGKSSFIKMWQAFLESDEGGCHPCVRFDAWKHDFNQDPLLSLMGEIGEFVSKQIEDKSKQQQALTIFNKCAAKLPGLLEGTSSLLNLAACGLSFIAPPVAALTQVAATGTKAASEFAKGVQEYTSKGHATLKQQLDEFRTELEKFVSIVTEEDEGKPFYFFVDELDRCEPLYAIRLLESVKHFYDVPNIIFVLAVDKERLAGMVRRRYGGTYDETGYLKRFVDINYTLPHPSLRKVIENYITNVVDIQNTCVGKDEESINQFLEYATSIAKALKLKPRDVEKALMKLYPSLTSAQKFNIITSKSPITNSLHTVIFIGPAYFALNNNLLYIPKNFYHPYLIYFFLAEKIDLSTLDFKSQETSHKICGTLGNECSEYVEILTNILHNNDNTTRINLLEDDQRAYSNRDIYGLLASALGNSQLGAQYFKNMIQCYNTFTNIEFES
jgi:hypothetical protein